MTSRPYYASGSSINIVSRCPASAVIPHARWASSDPANMGSALHEHMADRVTLGVEVAFERLFEVAARWELSEESTRIFGHRCRAFTFVPPAGAIAEYPLALLADGSVRCCRGARGDYEVPEGTILPLTLDCMWSEPEPLQIMDGLPVCPPGSVLWTPDWKSGSEMHPDPVEYNMQPLSTALAAGRLTGAQYVMPAIVYWRAGEGEWDVRCDAAGTPQPYSMDELKSVEEKIRATHAACLEQQARQDRGEPLQPIQGNHCTHCGARTRCPPKVAMVRAVLTGDLALADLPQPLTADQRKMLAEILPQIDRWSRQAKDVLKSDVDVAGPVPLGEGRVWGPHTVLYDEIDPVQGLAILAEDIGEEAARVALKVEMSKDGVKEAIRTAHAAAGIRRQMAASERRFFGKAKAEGALGKRPVVKYEAHKSVATELPDAEEDAVIEMSDAAALTEIIKQ